MITSLKWNTFAGGTAADQGKHSYQAKFRFGEYDIKPPKSRHWGYTLFFVNSKGALKGSGGLWQQVGRLYASPNLAKGAAREHYLRHFTNTARAVPGNRR